MAETPDHPKATCLYCHAKLPHTAESVRQDAQDWEDAMRAFERSSAPYGDDMADLMEKGFRLALGLKEKDS